MKTSLLKLFSIAALATAVTSCTNMRKQQPDLPNEYHLAHTYLLEGQYDSMRFYLEQAEAKIDQYEHSSMYVNNLWAWYHCMLSHNDSTRMFAMKAYNEMLEDTSIVDADLIANMQIVLGYSYMEAYPDSAQILFENCLPVYRRLGITDKIIETHLYLSEIYREKHDFIHSLEHLRYIEQICDTIWLVDDDPSWMVEILCDIAGSSIEMGDFRQANGVLLTATQYIEIADKESRTSYLYQRTRSHFYQNEYTLAANSASRLEALAQGLKMWDMLAKAYVMRGLALSRIGGYDIDAEKFSKKAQEIADKHDVELIEEKLLLDGELATHRGDFVKAHTLLFDSVKVDQHTFNYNSVLESQMSYYKALGDYQKMCELMQKQRIGIDSIYTNVIYANENNRIESSRSGIDVLRAELTARNEKISTLIRQQYVERVVFLILMAITISIIVYYIKSNGTRNRVKIEREHERLQKEIENKIDQLEQQKEILQKTNMRISESISYAERIQRSIIPPASELTNYPITDAFIFYSPLDVVSGDFYWFTRKGNNLLVCCADCTGHGVPGAFMSMIASTVLNDIINNAPEDITPAEILEKLDLRIVNTLGSDAFDRDVPHDGLDTCLVSINLVTHEVISSAARRPLIMIRDQEIITIKGTKRSVGDVEPVIRERKFENTHTQLHENDAIYMYTDGYSDQFGGQEGEKMKDTKIKRFLRAIHDEDMDEQCLTVQELFTQWKADNPQIDDVLFIGIKI